MTSIDDMIRRKDEKKIDMSDIDRRIEEITRKKPSPEEPRRREEPVVRRDIIPIEELDIVKGTDSTDRENDKKTLRKVIDRKKMGLRRREMRMYNQKEYEGTKSRVWVVISLAIAGLMFIFVSYYTIKQDWVLILMILLGSMLFLPVGMVLGWAILDPYVRAKILRKVTRHNWGIINFVGKGQKIFSKVKNFDTALIWKKNEVWIITREHVYQLTKDGDAIVKKDKIDPESIVTLIDTVPVLFVDVDSMQPLSLARDRREGINPLELGSTLKAWVDNQLAKAMFLKKTMDIYFVIIIVCSIISVGIAYLNMTRMEDLDKQLKIIQSTLSDVLSRLPEATPPG